jgi:hypothetical protein
VADFLVGGENCSVGIFNINRVSSLQEKYRANTKDKTEK